MKKNKSNKNKLRSNKLNHLETIYSLTTASSFTELSSTCATTDLVGAVFFSTGSVEELLTVIFPCRGAGKDTSKESGNDCCSCIISKNNSEKNAFASKFFFSSASSCCESDCGISYQVKVKNKILFRITTHTISLFLTNLLILYSKQLCYFPIFSISQLRK